MTKVTKVTIPAEKVAYLQAGIHPGERNRASLGEIGHFCTAFVTFIARIATFARFYATFAHLWASQARFRLNSGFPRVFPSPILS